MALNSLNNLSSPLQNAINAVSQNQTAASTVAKANNVKSDGVHLSSSALKDAGSTVQMMYGVFNPLPGLEEGGSKDPSPAQMMYGCFNPLPGLEEGGDNKPGPTQMMYGLFNPDFPNGINVKAPDKPDVIHIPEGPVIGVKAPDDPWHPPVIGVKPPEPPNIGLKAPDKPDVIHIPEGPVIGVKAPDDPWHPPVIGVKPPEPPNIGLKAPDKPDVIHIPEGPVIGVKAPDDPWHPPVIGVKPPDPPAPIHGGSTPIIGGEPPVIINVKPSDDPVFGGQIPSVFSGPVMGVKAPDPIYGGQIPSVFSGPVMGVKAPDPIYGGQIPSVFSGPVMGVKAPDPIYGGQIPVHGGQIPVHGGTTPTWPYDDLSSSPNVFGGGYVFPNDPTPKTPTSSLMYGCFSPLPEISENPQPSDIFNPKNPSGPDPATMMYGCFPGNGGCGGGRIPESSMMYGCFINIGEEKDFDKRSVFLSTAEKVNIPAQTKNVWPQGGVFT